MAGYRNYVAWKPNLPYTGGSSSPYASRDGAEIGDSTTHLGLNASVGSYRPSFVGGSYRSVKRDAPFIVPLQKSYETDYRNGHKPKGSTSNPRLPEKLSPQSPQRKYDGNRSSKNVTHSVYNYQTSASSLSKLETRSKNVSPVIERISKTSLIRARSRDPSPLLEKRRNTIEYNRSVNNLPRFGHRSRDPSPSTCDPRLGLEIRGKNNLKARPTEQTSVSLQYKSNSNLSENIYRPDHRPRQCKAKSYGMNYTCNRSSITTPSNAVADESLSYMSISDFQTKSILKPLEYISKFEKLSLNDRDYNRKSTNASNSESKNQIDIEELDANIETNTEPDVVIFVKVVSRATSPTPPGTSPIIRARRLGLAKTVEKTIQRSKKKPTCEDKEIQSDRLDDTTKYSRFNSVFRLHNNKWSNTLLNEAKSSGNDNIQHAKNPSNPTYIPPGLTQNELTTIKNKNDISLAKSKSSSNETNEGLVVSPELNTKKIHKIHETPSLCPTENSSRALPPTVPKADISSKTANYVPESFCLPNKDFRKSALNVGPTDLPRKSRTPSTSTDTEEKSEPLKSIESVPETENIVPVAKEFRISPNKNEHGCVDEPGNQEEDHSNSNTFFNKCVAFCDNKKEENSPKMKCVVDSANFQHIFKSKLPMQVSEQKKGAKSKLSSISNCFDVQTQNMRNNDICAFDESCNDKSPSRKEEKLVCTSKQEMPPINEPKRHARQPSCDSSESIYLQNTSHEVDPGSSLIFAHMEVYASNSCAESDEGEITDNFKSLNHKNIDHSNSNESFQTESRLTNESIRSTEKCSSSSILRSGSAIKDIVPGNIYEELGENRWLDLNSTEANKSNNIPLAKIFVNDGSLVSNEYHLQNKASKATSESGHHSEIKKFANNMTQHESNYLFGKDNQNSRTEIKRKHDHEFELNYLQPKTEESGSYIPWWMTEISEKFQQNGVLSNVRRIESGERAGWLSDSNNSSFDLTEAPAQEHKCEQLVDNEKNPLSLLTGITSQLDSDDLTRWMQNKQGTNCSSASQEGSPLLLRHSPEGLEDTNENIENLSLVDNKTNSSSRTNNSKSLCIPNELLLQKSQLNIEKSYISQHTDVDELLDGLLFLNSVCNHGVVVTTQSPTQKENRIQYGDYMPTKNQRQLDDAAVQVYKDGDFGAYLDLESSLAEQAEEIEGLTSSRKNSLVVRTQLSVRVHTIIEKLLSSEGSELRRALFSLKQIFQEDKDLVHGFVALGGLNCLVRVGSFVDQNFQNYILRALGQVMLYVDGMNGVMNHGPTIQWLYSLISSKYRLVVKTALKLLLVFVEYVETNSILLVNAIRAVDKNQKALPWSNVMKLLRDNENADTELLIYATSLINKTLFGLNDQDSFYDESDFLEQQGMEGIIQRYMSRPGTDLNLLHQLQLYEAALKFEDGETTESVRMPDNSLRKTQRLRNADPKERRKSRRHSSETAPSMIYNTESSTCCKSNYHEAVDEDSSNSSSSNNSNEFNSDVFRENKETHGSAGVTPALRRRRERAERQLSFMRDQITIFQATSKINEQQPDLGQIVTAIPIQLQSENKNPSEPLMLRLYKSQHRDTNRNSTTSNQLSLSSVENARSNASKCMITGDFTKKNPTNVSNLIPDCSQHVNVTDHEYDEMKQTPVRKEPTVKDLTQKLKKLPTTSKEEKYQNQIGGMTGLISKAKEGLAKGKSKGDVSRSPSVEQDRKKLEPKKSENELHWEGIVRNLTRPLTLCDLDFTDLNEDDEKDVLAPRGLCGAVPPPPPPIGAAPPVGTRSNTVSHPYLPPPPTNLVPMPNFGYDKHKNQQNSENNVHIIKKNKKTVKLFWKEVREDMLPSNFTKTIWDELPKTAVDIQKLEHLFESRAKDLTSKEKQQEMNRNKEIIVLSHKRSNAINIAITKLPPPRAIKAAILKMDQTVVTREAIDKLLNMLPTDEERAKIQEAQMANPELPLGSAEQFLLTLSSISELGARLKLWAFKLDFENTEKEIAEPLNDLKQGIELLKTNKTFKSILSTLLSIGIFLNGTPVKGFQIEYLAKVPEVKDTVHKHSLLHHLCHMVMETSPDTTDLYSEIGSITRASKTDFTELAHNITYLETECKASWDRLKVISKHDCPVQLKQKLVEFLGDCAERIIILEVVHRRVTNRYHKFLLWLGVPLHKVAEWKPNEFCRILSEFALEYRTTRERVQQQIEKKANHRERNKTRGKMIVDVDKLRTQEDRADAELKQLLGSSKLSKDNPDGTSAWRRRRADDLKLSLNKQNEDSFTDGDDEILESLVKTATKAAGSRPIPRERKRTRHVDRKSLKRSRTREGFSAELVGTSNYSITH